MSVRGLGVAGLEMQVTICPDFVSGEPKHQRRRDTMKTLPLLVVLSLASCIVMIVVDYILGPRAEFLNAYSVFERILGREVSVGESFVAREFGKSGELLAVLIVSLLAGYILTILARVLLRAR